MAINRNTRQVRVYNEDAEILEKICHARYNSKETNLEKTIPTSAKIIKLALRYPGLKEALINLPAKEDVPKR